MISTGVPVVLGGSRVKLGLADPGIPPAWLYNKRTVNKNTTSPAACDEGGKAGNNRDFARLIITI
jgi:hypothetical protein